MTHNASITKWTRENPLINLVTNWKFLLVFVFMSLGLATCSDTGLDNDPMDSDTGDGDSDADLAVANSYSQNVSILLNNGNGTFQTAINYLASKKPYSVFACDLNGDDYPDLAMPCDESTVSSRPASF